MSNASWFIVIGFVLLFMALTAARIKRLPLSTAIIYLGVGVVLGPSIANKFHFNPLEQSQLLEVITEIAVLISLFGAGLKLAAPMGDRVWWTPFRLATVSMVLTVGFTAFVAMLVLDLSVGPAVLLGAILAPTDPVLASDVQLQRPDDDDRLRFALTGEAGLNDGTAFPMVMLGLGLIGLHDLGDQYTRWILIDVIWATGCGLAVGGALGAGTAWLIKKLGKRGIHSEFMEDFLGLGLIALSYGASLLLAGYGFLAVFAAGFLLHRTEFQQRNLPIEAVVESSSQVEKFCCDAKEIDRRQPSMSHISLNFVEQHERIGEVILLILVGGMLFINSWQPHYVVMAIILLFMIRPLSVFLGLLGDSQPLLTKTAIAWFGIRGIGSFYYLMYAIQHGLETDTAVTLISVVLVVVTSSILLHGITVTPLMRAYRKRLK